MFQENFEKYLNENIGKVREIFGKIWGKFYKNLHILTEELETRKVSARWVLRMQTQDNCRNCMGARLKILMRCNEEGASYISWIVTGNETWLHYWMPECKSVSIAPQKFKQKTFAGKVLAIIFWDHKGVLLEYCTKGSIVTSASYFDTLIRLQKAIKSKRTSLLSKKSFFCVTMPLHTRQSSLKICSTN